VGWRHLGEGDVPDGVPPRSRRSRPWETPPACRTLRRIHHTLIAFGIACPVSDLFGTAGRQLLARLALPEPWRGTLEASLRLIDELDREIAGCERELRQLGADHRYVPQLISCPGIAWVLAYTIASEIGSIERFPTARKLTGYTGLCPKVDQSGERDWRGPLKKNFFLTGVGLLAR
jgi:transposase